MDNKFCLSFDIGGTFIKYGVVDNCGNVHMKNKIDTPKVDGKENVPKVMIDIYNEIKNNFDVSCIGVSTLGQVNTDEGAIGFAVENIKGYSGTRIRDVLKKETGLEVFVDNDVNTAAAGELWLGAGKEHSSFLCVTLGTGIGGAIVIDSKIFRGANFSAGEVGHFFMFSEGEKCNCGKVGCFERYGSTSALIRQYKKELEVNNIEFKDEYDGEYIVELAKKHDPIAVKVYDRFLDYVAYGFANIMHILDIGTIVVGGGISAQGKPFLDEINKRFKKFAISAYHEKTKIIAAKLVNDAGIIGAAFNGFKYTGIL